MSEDKSVEKQLAAKFEEDLRRVRNLDTYGKLLLNDDVNIFHLALIGLGTFDN